MNSVMQFHEVANIFPMMSAEEFDALKLDIAQNGLIEPIWTHDGKIIDGRNRYNACQEVGIKPQFREYTGQGGAELVAFVVSLNLKRRHLDAGQKAFVALEIEPMLAAFAKERQRGGQGGVLLSEKIQQANEGKAAAQAAAIVGTNAHYVADAKRLTADAPELAARVKSGEMKMPAAIQEMKRAKTVSERTARVEEINKGSSPLVAVGQFDVIYADPPWRYQHSISESRAIENQYPTMDLPDICALPVGNVCATNCVLFMWATSPKLAEAMLVIESWGFEYKTCMVWVKDKIGMGYYARQRHELLLIATRGTPETPEPASRPDSVIEAPRGKHSAKPDEFYSIIERMYPGRAMIELFSRSPRAGWMAWGNQA